MRISIILLAFIAMLAAGCNKNNKALREKITDADSVAINYYKGDGSMDSVILVKIIRDKASINQLVNLVSQKVMTSKNHCGYDGSLHFFKSDRVIQDIDFRINEDACRQFSFSFNGSPSATELSEEAKTWITKFNKP